MVQYYTLMLKKTEKGNKTILKISPNNSSSVQQNILFFGGLGLICLTFGIGFFVVGAPMILPFAGLEVIVLVIVLVINRSWTNQEEQLEIDPLFVFFKSKQTNNKKIKFDRFHSKFLINKKNSIILICKTKKLRIGKFLNEEDLEELAAIVRSKVKELNNLA